MNELSLPYHLIISLIISTLILGIIIYKRKVLFKNGKRKLFWISLTVFFVLYLLIVVEATYTDISSKYELIKFDLNKDGFFNGDEITIEQKKAMSKVISDTGRNFSFITGLIFAGIIAFFVFVIGKVKKNLKK